jgi:hypothetical protein
MTTALNQVNPSFRSRKKVKTNKWSKERSLTPLTTYISPSPGGITCFPVRYILLPNLFSSPQFYSREIKDFLKTVRNKIWEDADQKVGCSSISEILSRFRYKLKFIAHSTKRVLNLFDLIENVIRSKQIAFFFQIECREGEKVFLNFVGSPNANGNYRNLTLTRKKTNGPNPFLSRESAGRIALIFAEFSLSTGMTLTWECKKIRNPGVKNVFRAKNISSR